MVGISVTWTTAAFWPLHLASKADPTGPCLVVTLSSLQKFIFLKPSSPDLLCIFCATVSFKAQQSSTCWECTGLTNGTSIVILEKYFRSVFILVQLPVFLSVGELRRLDQHVMRQLVRYPGDFTWLFKGTSCLLCSSDLLLCTFFGSLLVLLFFSQTAPLFSRLQKIRYECFHFILPDQSLLTSLSIFAFLTFQCD